MAKLTAGSRIGPFPYRIIRPLDSHGGMSDVYMATDGNVDDPRAKRVIVKIARVHEEHQSFYENTIYNESERLRNLHHRGIVRILPVRMESDMRNTTYAARTALPHAPWFLVLENLEGSSVDKLLERHGRLDPGSALEIVRIVADTLQFLHDQNQVHLDIKPENILFRRPLEDGPPMEPVLIDFGVARSTGQEGLEARTLPYAPPERVAVYKQNQPPETLSKPHPSMDVYSLGVVLYQLLTGKRPFEGRSNKKLSSAIMEGNPTLPSHYVSSLPRTLDSLVLSALNRDPAQRPTAGELARRCTLIMREAGLSPLIMGVAGSKASGRRRRRGPALTLATLLIAALVGGLLWLNGSQGWTATLTSALGALAGSSGAESPDNAADAAQAVAIVLPPTPTETHTPSATPTRPPKSTAVPIVPTVTPSNTPTPTATATATEVRSKSTQAPPPSPTPTRAPTRAATPTKPPPKSTAVRPTATRTATPRPTSPTAAPAGRKESSLGAGTENPEPTAAATPTATRPAVSTQSGGPTGFVAISPPDNVSIDARITFEWRADRALADNQVYELVLFRPWQDVNEGRARDNADSSSRRELNLTDLGPGDYEWGVFLGVLQSGNYSRLRYLGDGGTLRVGGPPEPQADSQSDDHGSGVGGDK